MTSLAWTTQRTVFSNARMNARSSWSRSFHNPSRAENVAVISGSLTGV
jgi:hypothetical protein